MRKSSITCSTTSPSRTRSHRFVTLPCAVGGARADCSLQLNFLNYAPVAPYPQKLLPFQKTIHSFFLPDHLREELQRKGEAALQTMPREEPLQLSLPGPGG